MPRLKTKEEKKYIIRILKYQSDEMSLIRTAGVHVVRHTSDKERVGM